MIHKKKIASLILAAGLVAGFTAQSADAQITFQRGDLSQYQSMDIRVNLDDGIHATSSDASALSPVNKAGGLIVNMLNSAMSEQTTDNTPWVHNEMTITFHSASGDTKVCDLSKIIATNLSATQTITLADYCQ